MASTEAPEDEEQIIKAVATRRITEMLRMMSASELMRLWGSLAEQGYE